MWHKITQTNLKYKCCWLQLRHIVPHTVTIAVLTTSVLILQVLCMQFQSVCISPFFPPREELSIEVNRLLFLNGEKIKCSISAYSSSFLLHTILWVTCPCIKILMDTQKQHCFILVLQTNNLQLLDWVIPVALCSLWNCKKCIWGLFWPWDGFESESWLCLICQLLSEQRQSYI